MGFHGSSGYAEAGKSGGLLIPVALIENDTLRICVAVAADGHLGFGVTLVLSLCCCVIAGKKSGRSTNTRFMKARRR
jgi:hypothetical protein